MSGLGFITGQAISSDAMMDVQITAGSCKQLDAVWAGGSYAMLNGTFHVWRVVPMLVSYSHWGLFHAD